MIRQIAYFFGLFASLHAKTSWAQHDEGPQRSQLTIHSAPDVALRIVAGSNAEPLAECRGDCKFWALPGRYMVYTQDHTSGARHELDLSVSGFRQYRLIQGNDTLHSLGVGLEVAGVVASAVGFITLLSPVMSQTCESNCASGDNNGRIVTLGLGVMAAGIVTGVVGFALDASNRTGLVEVDAWSEASRRAPTLQLGVIPIFAGLGLGVTGLF